MHILTVTTSYPARPGDHRGVFVGDICEELAGRGHTITVLCPYPGHQMQDREQQRGHASARPRGGTIRVIRAGESLWGNREQSTFGADGVLETLARHPMDVLPIAGTVAAMTSRLDREAQHADFLLSHWLFPFGWICAEVAKRRNLPHLCIEHGGGARLVSAIPGLAALLAMRMTERTRIQFVSSEGRQRVLTGLRSGAAAGFLDRSFVFPVPGQRSAEAPSDRCQESSAVPRKNPLTEPALLRCVLSGAAPLLRVLMVARLVEGKGHDVLLEALRSLATPFRVSLVGEGPRQPELAGQIRDLSLAGHVECTGAVAPARLPEFYRTHHVLVVPSLAPSRGTEVLRGEGTPRVLLEAMTHGCVPIAARVGGIPDVVEHEINGLLFSPGDAGALARLLQRVAAEPALLPRLQVNAQQTAARYGFDDLWRMWREEVGVNV